MSAVLYGRKPNCFFCRRMTHLALSVTRVMHGVRIETFKLVWREEEAPLVAFYLCEEVLLLVVMRRCNVACGRRLGTSKCNYKRTRSYRISNYSPRSQIPYPPCQWAAGWMSAVPSFSGPAVCWSSSSWNRESRGRSFYPPCHSVSAANIPFK